MIFTMCLNFRESLSYKYDICGTLVCSESNYIFSAIIGEGNNKVRTKIG